MVKNHPFISSRGLAPHKWKLWCLASGHQETTPEIRAAVVVYGTGEILKIGESQRGTVGKNYRKPIQLSQNHLTYKVSLLEAWHVFFWGDGVWGFIHACCLASQSASFSKQSVGLVAEIVRSWQVVIMSFIDHVYHFLLEDLQEQEKEHAPSGSPITVELFTSSRGWVAQHSRKFKFLG